MISCRLQSVQICDFKSYKGLVTLNDFKQFTALIGPNGSGKSNFMDAIGFAFGENYKALRVNNLSELIHGSNVGKPESDQCFVTLVFLLEVEGTAEFRYVTKSFKRLLTTAISQETCRYEFNEQTVSREEYQAELKSIGIHNRGQNALVFQGNIGSISIQTPKQRCAYFERICGSKQFENEYRDSKLKMEEAQKNAQSTFGQVKVINHELKNITFQKQNLKTFAGFEEKQRNLIIEDKLFKLFHIDKDLEERNTTFESEIRKVQVYNVEKSQAKHQLDELKDEIKNKEQQIKAQIKQKVKQHETDLSYLKLEIKGNEENVHYLNEKMDRNLKSLKVAEKKCESYKILIQDLKENVDILESKLADHHPDTQAISKSNLEGRTRSLTDEQFEEYLRLRGKAKVQTSPYDEKLRSKKWQLEKYQHKLQIELIKKTNCEERIRLTQEKIEHKYGENDSLKVKLDEVKNSLIQKENYRDTLEKEIAEAQQKLPDLQNEKEKITVILKKAQLSQKKIASLSRLSEKFPGVIGRAIELCRPKDKRYSIALVKILREYANIIIVDKAETAKKCIQFLKDNEMEREMLSPLDEIEPQDICESLRDILNVQLAYDLIQFEPNIDLFVKLITQNILICENLQDASRLSASKNTKKGRVLGHTCITIDGVKYDKHGPISFGKRSLAEDAERWETRKNPEAESRMSEVIKELEAVEQKMKEKFTVKSLNLEIESLKTRIKFMQHQSDLTANKQQQVEAELLDLNAEREDISNTIQEITDIISTMEIEIQHITEKINDVEDKVFEHFCREIACTTIREYRNKDLGIHQKKREHIQQLTDHLKRVKDLLKSNESDYLNGMEEASEWKKNVAQTQAELKKAIEDKSVLQDEIRKIELKLENERSELGKIEAEIKEMKNKRLNCNKIIQCTTRKIDDLNQEIAEWKSSRKLNRIKILQDCQINGIQIPLKSVNLDSFDLIGGRYEEHDIEIDYSNLPEVYKDRENIEEIQQGLTQQINEIQECLNQIKLPQEKIDENYVAVLKEKQDKAKEKHTEFKQEAQRLMKRFEIIKRKRIDMFNSFMHKVNDIISNIYKKMTKSDAAQAFLFPENPEESYLGGIVYNCIPPGKKVSTTMEGLSGGEKTIASLTLLFAMQKVKPAPFFLLDEVDAALDPTNIKKLSGFIKDEAESLQFIIISLKRNFFSEADTLVGVTENDGLSLASGVFVFNLQKYK